MMKRELAPDPGVSRIRGGADSFPGGSGQRWRLVPGGPALIAAKTSMLLNVTSTSGAAAVHPKV